MEDDDEKIIELANLPAEVVADPEQFAAVVLDLGPNQEIVDEVFPALGVNPHDDSKLWFWNALRQEFVESSLAGTYRHKSWPEGVVLVDLGNDDPSWELGEWRDEEGDLPAGYYARDGEVIFR